MTSTIKIRHAFAEQLTAMRLNAAKFLHKIHDKVGEIHEETGDAVLKRRNKLLQQIANSRKKQLAKLTTSKIPVLVQLANEIETFANGLTAYCYYHTDFVEALIKEANAIHADLLEQKENKIEKSTIENSKAMKLGLATITMLKKLNALTVEEWKKGGDGFSILIDFSDNSASYEICNTTLKKAVAIVIGVGFGLLFGVALSIISGLLFGSPVGIAAGIAAFFGTGIGVLRETILGVMYGIKIPINGYVSEIEIKGCRFFREKQREFSAANNAAAAVSNDAPLNKPLPPGTSDLGEDSKEFQLASLTSARQA